MKSIASAPAKIILLGEHFVVYGSKAMLAAIDKRVTVTSTLTDKAIIKIKSVLGTLEVPTYVSYQEVKSEFRPFVYLAKKMINSTEWKNAKPAKGLEIEINSQAFLISCILFKQDCKLLKLILSSLKALNILALSFTGNPSDSTANNFCIKYLSLSLIFPVLCTLYGIFSCYL